MIYLGVLAGYASPLPDMGVQTNLLFSDLYNSEFRVVHFLLPGNQR